MVEGSDALQLWALNYLAAHGPSIVPDMAEALSADEYGLARAQRLRYALDRLERDARIVRLGRRSAVRANGSRVPGPPAWVWALPAQESAVDA